MAENGKRVRKRNVKRVANNRKTTNRKKRDLLKPFLFLVCLAAISFGVYWTTHTPKLRVTKALVSGLRYVSPTLVWQDVRPAQGKNIFLVDTKSLRKRIMRHPEVADVKIGRKFPRTLTVNVVERTPVGVVRCKGNLYMIDSAGIPFRTVSSPVKALTLVELPYDTTPVLGRPLRGPKARAALVCLKESTKNICRVDKISVDQRGNICLNIGSNFFVKLGQPVDISRKLSVLRSTLEAKPAIAAKVLYFDISCLERPVWKPKDAAGEVQATEESQDSANAVVR